MKKITFLVAAALVSTGLSAQTVQKWSPYQDPDVTTSLFFPWNTSHLMWIAEDGDVVNDSPNSFEAGSIALFNDEPLAVLQEPDFVGGEEFVTDEPVITISPVEVGGVIVDNSEITYHFVPATETVTITGTEGATFTKKGTGTLYTDVASTLNTVLEGGSIMRESSASASSTIFGKKVTVNGNATIHLGNNTSNKPYYTFNADVDIPEGSTLNLYAGRYVYMAGDTSLIITGKGTLNLYGRGDRVTLAASGSAKPVDFSGFEGTFNILKGEDFVSNCGFYGAIFPAYSAKGTSASKAFYAKLEGDSLLYNVWKTDKELLDSLFYDLTNVDMFIGDGAAIACESAGGSPNVSMVAVKSLNVSEKGIVAGYYKDSNPQLVLLFGRDNKDCYIDGTVTAYTKGSKPYSEDGVGLFKEGTGTCYVTAPDNIIYLGVEVWEGRMLFNNPDPENTTATGQNKVSGNNTVTCRPTATIGGFGTIGGHTALYGTMQPGSDAIGTLRIDGTNAIVEYDTDAKGIYSVATGTPIKQRTAGKEANLLVYDGAKMEIEIINKESHDQVLVQNELRIYPVETPTQCKVNIELSPRDEWSINANDTIEILKAAKAVSYLEGDVNIADCFTLTTSADFNDVTFSLSAIDVPAVTEESYQWNDEKFDYDTIVTVISPAEFKLVAVAQNAGSGSAEPNAIESVEADNSLLQVYPNPAVGGNVTVSLAEGEISEISIYNNAAQLVKTVVATSATTTIDVSDIPAGVYFVNVASGSKQYTQKLIVE